MVKKKICPRCKSTNVTIDWSETLIGRPTLNKYKCNKCGYESRLFPEID